MISLDHTCQHSRFFTPISRHLPFCHFSRETPDGNRNAFTRWLCSLSRCPFALTGWCPLVGEIKWQPNGVERIHIPAKNLLSLHRYIPLHFSIFLQQDILTIRKPEFFAICNTLFSRFSKWDHSTQSLMEHRFFLGPYKMFSWKKKRQIYIILKIYIWNNDLSI